MKLTDYQQAVFEADVSSSAKLDALAIGSFYNYKNDEMCWPSNKTLSRITGLSVSTISRAHKELVNAGLLEVWRRIDNSNMYRPLIPIKLGYGDNEDTSINLKKRVYRQYETNYEYNYETNYEYNNEMNKEKDSNESLHIINSNLNQGGTTSFGTNERPFEYERTAAAGPAGRGDSLPAESMRHAGRDDSADARESEANQKLVRAFQSDWLD